jgi:hypothetical protein
LAGLIFHARINKISAAGRYSLSCEPGGAGVERLACSGIGFRQSTRPTLSIIPRRLSRRRGGQFIEILIDQKLDHCSRPFAVARAKRFRIERDPGIAFPGACLPLPYPYVWDPWE